jgi:hypothetical protein
MKCVLGFRALSTLKSNEIEEQMMELLDDC